MQQRLDALLNSKPNHYLPFVYVVSQKALMEHKTLVKYIVVTIAHIY